MPWMFGVFALAAIGLFALAARFAIEARDRDDRALRGARAADAKTAASIEAVGQRSLAAERAPRASMEPAALEAASVAEPDSAAAPNDEKRASLRKSLTTAIEVSLAGALDPTAILAAGLELLDRPLARGELPQTAPDGSLRYTLRDCPAGVQAEFWVARSTGSTYENVLALRIQVDAPAEPYLLEGAVRKNPVAHIQAFLDRSGNVTDLVLMTDVAPSGASRQWGLRLDEGRIAEGIVFHVDTARPGDWKAESYGLVDGADRSWSDPIALLGDPWPESSSLAQLGSGLLSLLSEARR